MLLTQRRVYMIAQNVYTFIYLNFRSKIYTAKCVADSLPDKCVYELILQETI